MKVVVYADVICPWCVVGDVRLGKAAALVPNISIDVEWRAFQLNPAIPANGVDRAVYYVTKFGGRAKAMRVYDAVAAAGAEDGLTFNFDAIRRTPNTVQAHRLIYRAQSQGRPRPMIDALFKAYFHDGRDIGDDEELSKIASSIGEVANDAEAFLAGDRFREQVLADDAEARRMGVSGAPFFVFGGRYAVSGAQPPEALARAIETAALA